MSSMPKRVLDHFDILNIGMYGSNVDQRKLAQLQEENFLSLPWSFPTRNLLNLCEVVEMYQFRGIIELPYIRNQGIKMLRKLAKAQIVFPRSRKFYDTKIRSNIGSLFLLL